MKGRAWLHLQPFGSLCSGEFSAAYGIPITYAPLAGRGLRALACGFPRRPTYGADADAIQVGHGAFAEQGGPLRQLAGRDIRLARVGRYQSDFPTRDYYVPGIPHEPGGDWDWLYG